MADAPLPLSGPPSPYDNALMGILQDCAKLPVFLDAVFSFLARRTDFYILLTSEQTKMGFAHGVAEGMVLQSFKKYEILTRKAEAERMKAEQTRQLDAMTGVTSHSGKPRSRKKKKGSEAEREQPTPQDELPISMPQPVNNTNRRVVYQRIPLRDDGSSEVKEVSHDTDEPGEAVSDAKDGCQEESASEEESEEEKEVEKKTKKQPLEKPKVTSDDTVSDTYNGGVLDNYKWSQTMTDVDVKVPVVSGTKGKDVSVDIKSDHLKVVLHKPEKKVVIDGKLLHKVKVEDSLWSIDSANSYLTVNLEKCKEIMWKSVLVGEEGIDLTKVDTTRDISEFDPECQAAIQRVSYDHHMKMLGKPTSGQAKAHEILKKAWNAEGSPFKGTPFDPSRVNITGNW